MEHWLCAQPWLCQKPWGRRRNATSPAPAGWCPELPALGIPPALEPGPPPSVQRAWEGPGTLEGMGRPGEEIFHGSWQTPKRAESLTRWGLLKSYWTPHHLGHRLTGEDLLSSHHPPWRREACVCFSFFAVLHAHMYMVQISLSTQSCGLCSASESMVWPRWTSLRRGPCYAVASVWCPLLYMGTERQVRRKQPPYLKPRRMAEAMTSAEKESA